MAQSSPDSKQLQQIIRLLQLDPEQRTNKMIQNLIRDDSYFPQLSSYLPQQDQEVKVQCLKYMKYECFAPNTSVFNIDEKGEKFYLILSGVVGVFIRKNRDDSSLYKVKELFTGQGFGELALISNKSRSASIICLSTVHLASLEKSKFNTVLKAIEQQRLQQNLQNLTKIPYFSNWSEAQLKQIFYNSFRQQLHKNEKVFEENQETDSVYIILEGEFMQSKSFRISDREFESNRLSDLKKNFIVQENQNCMKNIQLTIMQKNELFGEEDIIDQHDKRSFTVVCLSISGEVLMIKQRDFQRIIMNDERSRKLIEKRLLMKNVVRNARIESIAAQFGRRQNRILSSSPTKTSSSKDLLAYNGKRQTFEDEITHYHTHTEENTYKNDTLEAHQEQVKQQYHQGANNKYGNSPKQIKKKVQKDILIKGFQEQLKLNLVKKFNTIELERIQNHLPEQMVQNIDSSEGEAYRILNLKQKHNNDIRLTAEQKQTYYSILKKRQAFEQQVNEYEQRTFNHLVSCTSLENLNKSHTLLQTRNNQANEGSQSTRNLQTASAKQRFSTPEIKIRKSGFIPTRYDPYFNLEQNQSNLNINTSKSTQFIPSQTQIGSSSINIQKYYRQQPETQASTPQIKSPLLQRSQNNIFTCSKSEQQFCRKDNIKLKKCEDSAIQTLRTLESEVNLSQCDHIQQPSHQKQTQQPNEKAKVKSPLMMSSQNSQKNMTLQQFSHYNNFINPYHRVLSQIKKKKLFEDKIKDMILSAKRSPQYSPQIENKTDNNF